MVDKGGLLMAGMKEVFKKVGSKVMKGEFTDLMKTPCPSYMHHNETLLDLVMGDFSFSRKYLKDAAKETDPFERIKHVIAFFVAPNHINPTKVQTRIPLNPILGETLQRELETGEKLYVE